MNLSPGAEAAWMIAAGEAAAGGHALIEPAHLLIGSLSLGKLGSGLASGELGTNAALVRDENARLLKALSSCGIEATRLRRRARIAARARHRLGPAARAALALAHVQGGLRRRRRTSPGRPRASAWRTCSRRSRRTWTS